MREKSHPAPFCHHLMAKGPSWVKAMTVVGACSHVISINLTETEDRTSKTNRNLPLHLAAKISVDVTCWGNEPSPGRSFQRMNFMSGRTEVRLSSKLTPMISTSDLMPFPC